MIRLITAVALVGSLVATATAPAAFAQHEHHAWCLQASAGKECAYDTLAQCRASKTSGQGRCVRNTPASNH